MIPNGTVIVHDNAIAQVGNEQPPSDAIFIDDVGIILPGFIDLHNHLTSNVLPRWRPTQKFANRYQWQATSEYDRLVRIPENRLMSNGFGCKADLYAEVKELAGGASSVTGSYLGRTTADRTCAVGLTRNLDHPSALTERPSRDDMSRATIHGACSRGERNLPVGKPSRPGGLVSLPVVERQPAGIAGPSIRRQSSGRKRSTRIFDAEVTGSSHTRCRHYPRHRVRAQ